jgi:hypothetical protein
MRGQGPVLIFQMQIEDDGRSSYTGEGSRASTKSTCRTVRGLGYRASTRTSEILATVVPEEWEDAQVPDGLWDLLLRPGVGNVHCQVLRGSSYRAVET